RDGRQSAAELQLGQMLHGSDRWARGHLGINIVDHLPEGFVQAVAGMRKCYLDFARDAPGVRGKDQNAVAHEDRFLDVVGDQQHRSGWQSALDPEVEKVGADRLRSHVECRKSSAEKGSSSSRMV